MNSVPEERNIILQENIPKLITSLTGFKPGDENFKICLQYTWSNFKHHRHLSLNSHEVKRDVAGICEKLKLNNFHEEEKQFKKIIEESLSHELAIDHYEKDVMYAILSLLISLAYDPISKLKDKKRRGVPIFIEPKVNKEAKTSSDNFICSLLKENFEVAKNETDSELSEWTESEDEEQKNKSSEEVVNVLVVKSKSSSTLTPPQKMPWYEKKKIVDAENWLRENIQNSWWESKIITSLEISSSTTHPAANFCQNWQRHLSKKSMGFIKPQPISLLTEYCLLREIFWMFINPVDCKFFKLEDGVISLRPNISMRSTSVESLQIFLVEFAKSMNINYKLKMDIEKAFKSSMSHTLEIYFKLLQENLNEITNLLLEEEEIVKAQDETYTTITLYNKMRKNFRMLEMLNDIHKNCILSNEKFPPHIRSSYLIASLNVLIKNAASKEKKNLCISFLVSCLRTFFDIFEIWWSEARLQDLQNEFLVEQVSPSNTEQLEIIQPRLFEKCKERSFYLNDAISKKIKKDPLLEVMRYFASEASFTLEIIAKLDRIHEMKQIKNGNEKSLYDKFLEQLKEQIFNYSSNCVSQEIHKTSTLKSVSQERNQNLIEDIKRNMIAEGDELMLQIFNSTFESMIGRTNDKIIESDNLFKILNNSTDSLLLPLEPIIDRLAKELLEQKISIAEKFVMDIYIKEFNVEQTLQEIRKVFFIESPDLMLYFTMKLFPQMEAGENSWANSYLLTSAFNEAAGGRLNSPQFLVQVNRRNVLNHVLDAIDEIIIYVSMNHQQNIENIFTSKAIQKYNEVFRFLLKIKWAQRILNCLAFPEFFRHRPPYSKLDMLCLVIKRLSLTRFSMLQAINTIHNRLMVMLQGLSHHLDLNISKTKKITELIAQHETFVEAFYKNSFMDENSKKTRGIIIEVLKLAKIIKDEWNNVETFATLDAAGKIEDSESLVKLNLNTIEIEKAFKACENQLQELLD